MLLKRATTLGFLETVHPSLWLKRSLQTMATFIEGPTANEIFDVFDESNSRVIGQERRGVVHAKGLWHRSVNILLLNSNGDMLVQKRMPTKDVCPGSWDVSVSNLTAVAACNSAYTTYWRPSNKQEQNKDVKEQQGVCQMKFCCAFL